MNKKDIGKRLKYLRINKQLTQEEVSKIVGSYNGTVVGNWERGKTKPKKQYLEKYASYFNVSIDWILTGENDCEMWLRTTRELAELDLPTELTKEEKIKVLNQFQYLSNHFDELYLDYKRIWNL